MPEAVQVADRLIHCSDIIAFNRADTLEIDVGVAGNDDADTIIGQTVELGHVELVGNGSDKNAVHAAGDIVVEIVVDILVAGADVDEISALHRGVFKADDDLAVKRVRRIVDHEGKLTGLVFCHAARDHIRLVVELLNGVQHQLPRLFRHAARAVQDIGDRRGGNACKLCYICARDLHGRFLLPFCYPDQCKKHQNIR